MLKIKEFSKVMFKATKMVSVISLLLIFSLSVVNAQDNNTAINNEVPVTTSNTTSNSEVPVTTSNNEKSNTNNNYEDFTEKGKANNSLGLYALGQIGYNGVAIASSLNTLAGFTINGLVGYQYLSFLSAEASLGFKYASRTDEDYGYKLSINHYAFDIKLYPLVFRYEFNLGEFSIIPRVGFGLGVAFGSIEGTADIPGYGSREEISIITGAYLDNGIAVTGVTTSLPIGVTFGIGKLLVGLTVEPVIGILISSDDSAESLSETRVTLDIGYKF